MLKPSTLGGPKPARVSVLPGRKGLSPQVSEEPGESFVYLEGRRSWLDCGPCDPSRDPHPPHPLRTPANSLLRGIQELVLAPAAVADPNAHVRPQTADGLHVATLQLSDLHRVYVLHPLGVDLKGGDRRVIGCGSASCVNIQKWEAQPAAPAAADVCLLAGV